jgi:Flp pilus assembly protein TadG
MNAMIRRLLRNSEASVLAEAAMFMPIFGLFTFGIVDLGTQMFVRQQVEQAVQAGASYAVINRCTSAEACLSGIEAAMNSAAGNASFCSGSSCTPSIGTCDEGPPTQCVTITASYPLTPILPSALYSWAMPLTVSATAIVRVL